MKTPVKSPIKRNQFGGIIISGYEIMYDKFKKSWQIWHPEIGFLAAFREKDKAITYVKNLNS